MSTPSHNLVVLEEWPLGGDWITIECPGVGAPIDHGCCPYCHKELDEEVPDA